MKEFLEPKHDWILLDLIDHQEKTASGLIMPGPGDYEALKSDRERQQHTPDRENNANKATRGTKRYRVLSVGPGNYVDVADELRDDVFLRKPMCCEVGDVVLVQEGALPITVDGEVKYLCHDYLVLASIKTDAEGKETLDVKHDYIFCRQATVAKLSKGGILLATAEDQTGNKALPGRWQCLGVGDGAWALRQEKGKIPGWERRPLPVQEGDEFAFEGGGFMVNACGASMGVVQAYQVACVFKEAA